MILFYNVSARLQEFDLYCLQKLDNYPVIYVFYMAYV